VRIAAQLALDGRGHAHVDGPAHRWLSAAACRLGAKMVGLVLGTVCESRDAAYPVGALVRGFGQWADHFGGHPGADRARSGRSRYRRSARAFRHAGHERMDRADRGARCGAHPAGPVDRRCPPPPAQPAAWPASVARTLGARVVGIARRPGEVPLPVWTSSAVDIAIDYKADDVAARLAAEVPGGLNAYFDNVGGPILDADAAEHGAVRPRGGLRLVAAYDDDAPLPGPARYDQVLMKRLRIEGFFLPDHFGNTEGFLPPLRALARRRPRSRCASMKRRASKTCSRPMPECWAAGPRAKSS